MGVRSGARRAFDWIRGRDRADDARQLGAAELASLGSPVRGLPFTPLGAFMAPSRITFHEDYQACEMAKADPIASLPCAVYRYDGNRRELDRSPLAFHLTNRLTTMWNPLKPCDEGLRWWIMAADTMGQAAVRIEWDKRGLPAALWPMDGIIEHRMTPGGLTWVYSGDETTPAGTYRPDEIMVLRSHTFSPDWRRGKSVAELAAAAVHLSIRADEYYAAMFENQDHFTGFLHTDEFLQDADVEHLKRSIEISKGADQAGETRIFDGGMTYEQIDMAKRYVNLNEQETFWLQRVCRVTRVPPSEVADLSRATYSNVEQNQLQFATRTLMPICRSLEVVLSGVLRAAGRFDSRVKINMDGLVRGDFKSRMEGYATQVQNGIASRDEIRAKEDMDPAPGGSRFLVPGNEWLLDERGDPIPWPREDAGATAAALREVKSDMDARVRERMAQNGANASTRAFAAKVLAPYARACEAAGIPYDIEHDIRDLTIGE